MNTKKNTLYLSFLFFLGLLASYILTALILKVYGVEHLGIFTTLLRLLKLLEVFCLVGMNVSIVKFASEDYTTKKNKIRQLYSFSLWKILFLSIPISIIVFFGSNYIANGIFQNELYIAPLKILSIVLPMASVKLFNEEFLKSLMLYKISEFFKKFGMMFLTIILVVFFGKKGLVNFSAIEFYFLIIALLFFISSICIYNIIKKLPYGPLEQKYKNNYKKISYSLFISLLILTLNSHQTVLLLEIISSSKNVGIFHFYFRLASICSFPLIISNNLIAPQIAPLIKASKMDILQKKINIFIGYSTLFTAILTFLILIVQNSVFLYFGNDFIINKNVFYFIILSQIFNVMTGPCTLMLQMGNKQDILIKNTALGLFISFILNIFLINIYGLSGAGIGFLISVIILNILNVIAVKNIYGIYTIFNPIKYVP